MFFISSSIVLELFITFNTLPSIPSSTVKIVFKSFEFAITINYVQANENAIDKTINN